jgi:pyridoxamine 5'-phosphate oxidase
MPDERPDERPDLNAQLAALRLEYTRAGLREQDVLPDAIAQFERWMSEAIAAGAEEPNAMTLATATPEGTPHARIVLLKGVDARGFTFFTNYESAKGREIAANPRASLVFFWRELARQVRIAGRVAPASRQDSEAYFATRPRGSQLGAWASAQSARVDSRAALDASLAEVTARFGAGPIPCPPRWGGYRLAPEVIELWQGRENRMHDRLRYTRHGQTWAMERLAP